MELAVGDRVIYSKYSGAEYKKLWATTGLQRRRYDRQRN
jgi:hypothetical protein